MNIGKIVDLVSIEVNNVINGFGSRYVKFYNENDDFDWTVRISNHMANPQRLDSKTISFVVYVPHYNLTDSENYIFYNNRFANHPNQFFLNENGDFTENFETLFDCLDYIIN